MKTQEQIDSNIVSSDDRELANEYRDGIFDHFENLLAVSDARMAFGIVSQMQRELKTHVKSLNPDKFRISKELGKTAYDYQIGNACKPVLSLRAAAIEHEEDIDEVAESARKDKWGFNPLMTKLHKDFFDSKSMSTSTNDLKVAVNNSTTLNAGLNRVFHFQKQEAEIAELRSRADEQEELIKKLTLDQVSTSIDVELIKEVSGWAFNEKEKAIALRERGATYKSISEVIGKSESTIKRWVNNTK